MAVLYVTEQGAVVHRQGRRLVVKKLGQVLDTVHTFQLRQLVVFGNVQLTAQAVAFLLQEGIDTVFMATGGRFRGRLVSGDGKNVDLRVEQFRRFDQEPFKVDLARRFVAGKLHNCRILLRRHQRNRPHPEVEGAAHRLRHLTRRLEAGATVDEVRGFEGAGAAAWFGVFSHLVRQEGFPFGGRTRRPPRDALNALLSFGYSLLQGTVTTAVQVVGLDPFLGCLHALENGRPSLVLDMMEELRPALVDAVVLSAVNRRQFLPSDFLYQEHVELPPGVAEAAEDGQPLAREAYPVLLRPESLRKWILLYEKALRQRVLYPPLGTQIMMRQVVLEQARRLARHVKGEEAFQAFELR